MWVLRIFSYAQVACTIICITTWAAASSCSSPAAAMAMLMVLLTKSSMNVPDMVHEVCFACLCVCWDARCAGCWRFPGTNCRHFTKPNVSGKTRVSLDFRCSVASCYDEKWKKPGNSERHGMRQMSFLPLLVALLPREAVRGVVTVLPLAIEISNDRMNASYVNVEHPAYRNKQPQAT